jgi:hypothetical protein
MEVPKWMRRYGMALMGIAALWGMRTPPEPEVIAQMQPAKGPEGSRPEPEDAPQFVREPPVRK